MTGDWLDVPWVLLLTHPVAFFVGIVAVYLLASWTAWRNR